MFKEYRWAAYALAFFLLLVAVSVFWYRTGHRAGERAAEAVCSKEKTETQIAAISNNTKSTAIGDEYAQTIRVRDTDVADGMRFQTCLPIYNPSSTSGGSVPGSAKPVSGKGNAVNSARLTQYAGKAEGWRAQVIGLIKENDLIRSICQPSLN